MGVAGPPENRGRRTRILACDNAVEPVGRRTGQILEFWKADKDRNVIAPDLQSFLTELVKYYETFDAEDFDEFFEVDEIEGYPKRFYAK